MTEASPPRSPDGAHRRKGLARAGLLALAIIRVRFGGVVGEPQRRDWWGGNNFLGGKRNDVNWECAPHLGR